MKASKLLEVYTYMIGSYGYNHSPQRIVVKLYANGEKRCSCNRFKPNGYQCEHLRNPKYFSKFMVGACRKEVK